MTIYYKLNSAWQNMALDFYPIGSFFISYNNISPADLFGGNWTQITSKFLYAATSTATGGAASHSHHVPIGMDSPSYDRNQIRIYGWRDGNYRPIYGTYEQSNSLSNYIYVNTNNSNSTIGGSTSQSGSINTKSSTASSLPPYQGVYCWYRVS